MTCSRYRSRHLLLQYQELTQRGFDKMAMYPPRCRVIRRLYHTFKQGVKISDVCTTPISSSKHFLNLPTEIRLRIFYHYLLALNIPDHFFSHLTLLGYWNGGGPVVARSEDRGFDLGRCISQPLVNLFLVNRQIHHEAEEELYRSFVFCIHPTHFYPEALRKFYHGIGTHLGQNVKKVQINIAMDVNGAPVQDWSQTDIVDKWRGAMRWISTELPRLHTVALAVDYLPPEDDVVAKHCALNTILSFARIFSPRLKVVLRFVNVKYEIFGALSPVSSPLISELIEEERLMLHLRDEKKLRWHSVAMHFNDSWAEMYTVTGLQARYNRLKVRKRQAEVEVECLKRFQNGSIFGRIP